MAVLAPMKNTIPMDIGTGDYSNEPDVIRSEPSFGLKFGFLKRRKDGSVFTGRNHTMPHTNYKNAK
jgi:hypothetical protein